MSDWFAQLSLECLARSHCFFHQRGVVLVSHQNVGSGMRADCDSGSTNSREHVPCEGMKRLETVFRKLDVGFQQPQHSLYTPLGQAFEQQTSGFEWRRYVNAEECDSQPLKQSSHIHRLQLKS